MRLGGHRLKVDLKQRYTPVMLFGAGGHHRGKAHGIKAGRRPYTKEPFANRAKDYGFPPAAEKS
jgi:hypothetical protein